LQARAPLLVPVLAALLVLAAPARAQLTFPTRYEDGRTPLTAGLLAFGALSCGSNGGLCRQPLVGGGLTVDAELDANAELTAGVVAAWAWLSDPSDEDPGPKRGRTLGRLALRGRTHGFSGPTWLGLEVGVALARDVAPVPDATGKSRTEVIRQYAPSLGLALGNNFVRFGPVALSAEFSAVTAFFPQGGPAFTGGARATGYGRRVTWTLGLGGRYGR
jgi:hypothetical protein